MALYSSALVRSIKVWNKALAVLLLNAFIIYYLIKIRKVIVLEFLYSDPEVLKVNVWTCFCTFLSYFSFVKICISWVLMLAYMLYLWNQVHTGHRLVCAWFLEIVFASALVSVHVCVNRPHMSVCVSASNVGVMHYAIILHLVVHK